MNPTYNPIPPAYQPFIEVRHTPHNSIFAKQPIPKGTRILAEKSCIPAWTGDHGFPDSNTIQRLVNKLRPDDQRIYRNLYAARGTVPDTVYANAQVLTDDDIHLAAVFYTNKFRNAMLLAGSHFQHSCCPNVHTTEELLPDGTQIFHTLRDIAMEQELTISRVLPWKARAQRQKLLRDYERSCTCAWCTDSAVSAHVDETLRLAFRSQQQILQPHLPETDGYWNAYIGIVKEQLKTFQSVGMKHPEIHKLLKQGLRAHATLGHWRQAHAWAKGMSQVRQTMSGLDHPVSLLEARVWYYVAKMAGAEERDGQVDEEEVIRRAGDRLLMSKFEFFSTTREWWTLLMDPDTDDV